MNHSYMALFSGMFIPFGDTHQGLSLSSTSLSLYAYALQRSSGSGGESGAKQFLCGHYRVSRPVRWYAFGIELYLQPNPLISSFNVGVEICGTRRVPREYFKDNPERGNMISATRLPLVLSLDTGDCNNGDKLYLLLIRVFQ